MPTINYKAGPNCLALILLAITVSVGLFNEYLVEVRRLKYVEHEFWSDDGDASIREFRINVSDKILNETFLKLHSPASPLKGRSGDRHSKLLHEIIDYWRNKYEWRKREAYFNKYPHYKTIIRGIHIHYVHVAPKSPKTRAPLLMLHGWPGSFKDFYNLIPLLTESSDFNFEIVIPSLVGHIFSQGAEGVGGPQQAMVFYNLMSRLGYENFYVYGNDWGSVIAADMAIMYPENVMGLYTPFCLSLRRVSVAKYFVESLVPDFLVGKEYKSKYSMVKSAELLLNEAFMLVTIAKPETIGFYLEESPAAIANYMLNIIKSITFLAPNVLQHKNLTDIYGYDNLIDIFMLYWITESTTSSIQSLRDIVHNYSSLYQIPIKSVPVACPKFLNGIFYQSDWILKDKYDYMVDRKTFSAKHFFFLEKNTSFLKVLAADIRNSVKQMMSVKEFVFTENT